jgi:serine/threonine protein kinase
MSQMAIDFIERLVRKDPNERMKASEALKHPFIKSAEQV